jgi:phage repressor protein C with HTH and peptisase S24 domain
MILGFERAEILEHIQVRIHGDSMWPCYNDGDVVDAVRGQTPDIGDIVVFKHPLKNQTLIKRVKNFQDSRVFVEGDNPDPLGTEDSHNFGTIQTSSIIAVVSV